MRPQPLKAGDHIGVVSTARRISPEELEPALKVIEGWGFMVKLGANLFEQHHQFAGTDKQRLEDLQNFIDDPEVKAILCARGGYGTVRLIDDVDFSAMMANPKWIGGYSDVTVLHNKLSSLGIASLHCSMPVNFKSNTPRALSSIKDAFTGRPLNYEVASHSFNVAGTAEAILVGGNLSMLYSQLGSNTALDTAGKILFMEDLDEYLYHIDRMMYNLVRNHYFEDVAGIIIGGMSDMNDNQVPFGSTAEEIIYRHIKDLGVPVCFGFPAGHLDDNRALVMNNPARLEVGQTVKLSMHG